MSLSPSLNSPSLYPSGRRLPWQFRVRPVLFVTVTAIVAILLLVGALVLTRRLIGAFSNDLQPGAMLFVAIAATAAISFARIAWRRNFPLETPEDLTAFDKAIGWASSLGLAALAVGCCYPAYRTTDWLIWLPLLIADQFWRQTFFDAGEPWIGDSASIMGEFPAAASSNSARTTHLPQDENPDENIVQQLYRLADEHGQQIIYGTVRADFVADQRTAVVHVGFCPPLSYLPEIEAEALPGSLAKIKVVQALAHGTRLEIRLPSPAEDDFFMWIDMAARPIGTTAQIESA